LIHATNGRFLLWLDVGAGDPQPRAPLLCFLAQPLVLATVLVGEVGRASQPELYEVLVEGVLVGTVVVRVQELLGHASIVITLDTYSYMLPGMGVRH
jgi:hypothetical protein